MNFLSGIATALIAFSSLFFGQPAQSPNLGAATPQLSLQALFETSLQASITSNATTATLVSGTDFAGNNLNGYYCFTVDAGTVQNEFMCGNVSSTAVTNLTRGVNPALGITANPALEFTHRRGADVKQTDSPYLNSILRIINGTDSFPSGTVLQYDPSISNSQISAAPNNLVDYAALASTSFSGTVNASLVQKGIVQEATQAQMAVASNTGSTGADLINPTRYNSLTASTSPVNVIASGTLDPSYLLNGNYSLGSTTVQSLASASTTFNGTSTFNTLPYLPTSTPTSSQAISLTYLNTVLAPANKTITLGSVSAINCNASTNYIGTSTITTSGSQGLLIYYSGGGFFGGSGSQTSNVSVNVYLDGVSVGSGGFSLQSSGAGAGGTFSISYASSTVSNATHNLNVSISNTGTSGCASLGGTSASGFAITYK